MKRMIIIVVSIVLMFTPLRIVSQELLENNSANDLESIKEWNSFDERLEGRKIFFDRCFIPLKVLSAALGGVLGGAVAFAIEESIPGADDQQVLMFLLKFSLVAIGSHLAYQITNDQTEKIANYLSVIELLNHCLHEKFDPPGEVLKQYLNKLSISYYKNGKLFTVKNTQEYFKTLDLFIKISKMTVQNKELEFKINESNEENVEAE